jgi:hypothetical protein
LQMSEPRILIRLLRMYFPRNWEFAQLCQNFGISGVFEPPPPVRHWPRPVYRLEITPVVGSHSRYGCCALDKAVTPEQAYKWSLY